MSVELKPCPFCGGEASLRSYGGDFYSVYCWNRTCNMVPATTVRNSAEKAITDWNTRAERTCREVAVDRFFRGCGECGYMWEYMYSIGKRVRPNFCPNCGAKVVEG